MEEFYKNIYSPSFWLLVGVFGTIFSVLANYIKDGLDKLISIFSSKWRNRTIAKKAAWNKKVQALVGNKDAQDQERKDEFSEKLNAIFSLIFCLLLAFVGSTMEYEHPFSFMWFVVAFLYTCAYVLFFRAISYQAKALNNHQSVLEAQIIESKKEIEALKAESAKTQLENSELEIEKRVLEKLLKTAP